MQERSEEITHGKWRSRHRNGQGHRRPGQGRRGVRGLREEHDRRGRDPEVARLLRGLGGHGQLIAAATYDVKAVAWKPFTPGCSQNVRFHHLTFPYIHNL